MELIDFKVGVMPTQRRNPETNQTQIVGVTVWYRHAKIRPISACRPPRAARGAMTTWVVIIGLACVLLALVGWLVLGPWR